MVFERFLLFLAVPLTLAGVSYAEANEAPSCAVNAEEPHVVDRAPSSERVPTNGMTVIQVDPSFPLDGLAASGYTVKTAKQFYAGNRWQDPDVRLRDRLLREAGFGVYTKSWRALELDFLFLRTQEQTLERLAVKYPQIPKTRFVTLKQLIAGEKAAER